MKKLFSNVKEDKKEEIVFRLYVLNLFLNVIFYFIVDSLNNINAILVFIVCCFLELEETILVNH